METTTTNKRRNRIIAAILLLLLLAIGVGDIYLHDQRTRNKQSAEEAAAMAWKMDTPTVTRPATPVITPIDNALPAPTETGAVASSAVRHHHKRIKSTVVPDDDVSITSAETFTGNVPEVKAEPAVAAPPPSLQSAPAVAQKTETKTTETTTHSRRSGRVNIAPEVGGNLNGFYNNHTSNLLTNGFHAGVMVNIALGDRFALQPEARYIMKGNQDKTTNTNEGLEVNTTHTVTLHYAEVPVNFVFKFGDKKGQPRFMVGAGPYVSYLVDSKDKIEATSVNSEGFDIATDKSTSKSTMKNMDAGVGGFLGCQMPKGFYGKAGAEVGLMDIQQNGTNRNYNFLISVGYIIGSKNKEY